MESTQLTELSLAQAAALIRAGELSPYDLTMACVDQIKEFNTKLNAFLTTLTERALEEAEQATAALTRGENWGPLHGIPIGIKDLIDVAGVATTAGSVFLRDNIADEDADVVRQLRAAGAIIIGKTHLHEFAIGVTNVNPHYGPAHNPWNPEFSPGGSSGGSAAAVAASMCLGALGTDTGGSVRVPAALCGLTGMRPSKKRVSSKGVIPMSWTLDTVGPMAHTARDVAILMDAIDNQPVNPARCFAKLEEPIKGLRVGIPIDDYFWRESDHGVVGAVRKAVDTLGDLGMQIVEVRLPQIKQVERAGAIISLSEAAAYHKERLESEPQRFGEDVRARLEWGTRRGGVDYAIARQIGREWRGALRTMFREQIDILVLPTTPAAALPIVGTEALNAAKEMLRFTYPFSLSALPSLSAPCGFTDDGFPIGMQLVALNEATLTQAANGYQQVTPWHIRRPDI